MQNDLESIKMYHEAVQINSDMPVKVELGK